MIFRFLPLLLLLLECLTGMAQSQQEPWVQAQEHIRRGEYIQSVPILQKLVESDSTQVEAALQLGFVQQRLGQLPAARKTYETVLRRDTSQTEALNQLAILSEKNAQYRRALHYYQRLIQLDTTNAYLFKQAAVQYSRLEQLGQAIAFYNKAVALNPQDIESWGELTRIHLDINDAAHLKLAGECVEKGLTIDPNSIRLLLQNSRVDFRLGRFAEVITSLQKTMAQGDSSAFYQRMLGRAYYEIDSLDQSIFTFRRLLNAGEETEYVYGGLGTAYLLKAKKIRLILISMPSVISNRPFNWHKPGCLTTRWAWEMSMSWKANLHPSNGLLKSTRKPLTCPNVRRLCTDWLSCTIPIR
ncbi:hypothetical protein BWI97_04265 [Siphonobacter sp. BAB-5405]|uniref:tetratricopeptide repeat protein n=1 Tax=Siphonobacter sp. BAB-5405 TaxID=1864825 RepID=UPI000C80526A|nr:tetratricopeptide repeat protein [Siphonobacter sp. BAB-5405]PMD98381.1 hypothetical protein BWI97_04265 [Siphonobacter sp. BAB-5405]